MYVTHICLRCSYLKKMSLAGPQKCIQFFICPILEYRVGKKPPTPILFVTKKRNEAALNIFL